MTEYAQGLRVRIDELPAEIEVEVRVRPEGPAQMLKKRSSDEWGCASLLLPGQGIEIKFIDKRVPRH